VGDKVMLTTLHQCWEYKASDKSCITKFFPQWDGPFTITKVFSDNSSYILHLPNSPDIFPSFHASLLKQHIANDAMLFPSHEHNQPGPVLTGNWMEEYHIKKNHQQEEERLWLPIPGKVGWVS
jgi:hypothetical protein